MGTNWRPKLPSECDYDSELEVILSSPCKIERCINLFCWIQRCQMFIDGNKRVANLVANKEMIRLGQGIIAIPVDLIGIYQEKLIRYYESGNNDDLKKFIYENCIDDVKKNASNLLTLIFLNDILIALVVLGPF